MHKTLAFSFIHSSPLGENPNWNRDICDDASHIGGCGLWFWHPTSCQTMASRREEPICLILTETKKKNMLKLHSSHSVCLLIRRFRPILHGLWQMLGFCRSDNSYLSNLISDTHVGHFRLEMVLGSGSSIATTIQKLSMTCWRKKLKS